MKYFPVARFFLNATNRLFLVTTTVKGPKLKFETLVSRITIFSHYLSKICEVYYKVKLESAIQLVISLLLLSNLNLYTSLNSPKNIYAFFTFQVDTVLFYGFFVLILFKIFLKHGLTWIDMVEGRVCWPDLSSMRPYVE